MIIKAILILLLSIVPAIGEQLLYTGVVQMSGRMELGVNPGGGVTCSGDWSDGDNEACEAAVDGNMCTTDYTGETDTNSILTTNSTDYANTGTKSVKIAMGAVDQVAYIAYDTGGSDGDCSVRFYLRIPDDFSTSAGGQAIQVMDGCQYAPLNGNRLNLFMLPPGLFATSSGTSSYINVSDGTWYRVELDYNAGGTCTFALYTTGDILVGSETFAGRAESIRYFDFGQLKSSTADALTYYIDDIEYGPTGGTIGPQ